MDDRLPTGVAGLDDVLGGGLPPNAINLVMGLPGSGKTLLAQQCVFANATRERPAAYLSTVSEPFEKIIRYGQTLDFFDPDAVGQRVFYEDLGNALAKTGLQGVLDQVTAVLEKYEPGLLVIDSFKPFSAFAESRSVYRRFLHELAGRLSVRPATSLWLGEYAVTDLGSAPEFAVADTVLWLATGRYDDRELRLLQVLKLRGSGFLSGRHSYRLSSEGMRVFPRLADPVQEDRYEIRGGWISSGVKTFDEALGDGYPRGGSILVAGPAGAGKTVLGLHFAMAGSKAGERTILTTFDENPSQLSRAAAGFGWSLTGRGVELMYRSSVDLYLDEWVYELLALMDSHDPRRVVIDGMSSLRLAARDPVRFQEYIYSLVQRCSRRGVSLLMTIESAELYGLSRMAEVPLSQIADTVVLLQFLRRDGEYRRALTVLKNRGAKTEPRLTEYRIGTGGIELREPERGRLR